MEYNNQRKKHTLNLIFKIINNYFNILLCKYVFPISKYRFKTNSEPKENKPELKK